MAALRRRAGLFAFFNREWRGARRLHDGLSKEKRKLSDKQRAEELAALASWTEARDAFVLDLELRECFGGLFRGQKTDLEKISWLNDWYLKTRLIITACPGLSERVNLTSIASDKIIELAAKAEIVERDIQRLAKIQDTMSGVVGADAGAFFEVTCKAWDAWLECLHRALDGLRTLIAFSNHHFYDNKLIIFPTPYEKRHDLGVKYRYVKNGLYKDRRNVPEAQRVVDAVLEHKIKRGNESLGVVTLNQTQRELIEELRDRKLKTFEEGPAFMDRWEAEGWPFF